MNSNTTPFLTAQWRHLAMLNYEVDPKILQSFLPAGTELDDWQGRIFVSIVGFQFLNTRVLGVLIPYHHDFEEVNLRFYVRRKVSGEWRRGVVFIKELVPRMAIAWVARVFYGENYVALPMWHSIEAEHDTDTGPLSVSYAWSFCGEKNRMKVTLENSSEDVVEGSVEEFITEHYWGYTRRRNGCTTEYRVEHPQWRVAKAMSAQLDCDVAGLYGEQFVEFLKTPASAFLADGSEITVFKGRPLVS